MAMDIDFLLRELERLGGSDLHLKVGRPPLMRISGDLLPTESAPLSEDDMRDMLYAIMTDRLIQEFEENYEADYSYEIPGLARFRVNMFMQRGSPGCVMRLIPLKVPTVDELGLPQILNTIADAENGLCLVTGPTGSGKSTTLAAMIQHINMNRAVHVITVEDPVEFVYTDDVATINQRELGIDSHALNNALRGALRQDPDIILMGEMRDSETIRFGITAAETGHLVFATLHTNNATQTIDRILDTMPPDARDMVRDQLSKVLVGIICQRLCKRADGTGRVAAQEILYNSANIAQLIVENKTRNIERAIGDGSYYGMQTFNQALHKLASQGIISQEEAMEKSDTPDDLKLLFRGIRRGTDSSELDQNDEATGSKGGGAPGGGKSGGGGSSDDDDKKKKFDRGFDF